MTKTHTAVHFVQEAGSRVHAKTHERTHNKHFLTSEDRNTYSGPKKFALTPFPPHREYP